jgi:hypothetical protein
MRISARRRQDNITRIRAAMDRLLGGDIPPGGKCDIKTLASAAKVDRTAFYGARPYAHLREEFERRLQAVRQAGQTPDPRDAQITRLKSHIDPLTRRIADRDHAVAKLTEFQSHALSRLAAQHEEIIRLREALERTSNVHRLPTPASKGI